MQYLDFDFKLRSPVQYFKLRSLSNYFIKHITKPKYPNGEISFEEEEEFFEITVYLFNSIEFHLPSKVLISLLQSVVVSELSNKQAHAQPHFHAFHHGILFCKSKKHLLVCLPKTSHS